MSGHVFHPGHAELHGVTVVVETAGPVTYVGRYDHVDESGVHLLDVGIHDAQHGLTKDDYLGRIIKFGVRSEHRHLVVPSDQVSTIRRLGDLG